MVDLKKKESSTELVKSDLQELHELKELHDLQELTATNQQLKDELDVARYKLTNELDLLTYKLEKTQSDIQDIRRDVHEINMTIDRLRRDLLDAMRNNRKSELSEILSNLFPLLGITAPVIMVLALFILMVALN